MNFLERIFGKRVNLQEVISSGAIIIDVRTKGEFHSGHLRNSINMPIDNLANTLKKLNKDRAIVTCCASGARSAAAKRILKSNGFEQVYNGGAWSSLKKYI